LICHCLQPDHLPCTQSPAVLWN